MRMTLEEHTKCAALENGLELAVPFSAMKALTIAWRTKRCAGKGISEAAVGVLDTKSGGWGC